MPRPRKMHSPAPLPNPPPAGGREEPRCPHCRAQDAEVISLFGTQAMTLQYRCRKCGTIFEAIKYE
jgi:uncharacterized Zn finger protein